MDEISEKGKDLGGKAKDTLLHGWGFLKKAAKETLDVTKGAAQVRELQKRHAELISDLGHRVYAMVQSNRLEMEGVKERCAEIEAIERDIERLQAEMGEKKAEIKSHLEEAAPKRRTCVHCNTPLGLLDRECPRCSAVPE